MEHEQILAKLAGMDGLEVEVIGTWIWVSGETRTHKDEIKAMGGWWCGGKKQWCFKPAGTRHIKGNSKMGMDEIRTKYGAAS